MILAAAACAAAGAAGISYIFNDDEQSTHTKYETVTISSTIVDKQGIIKYILKPSYSSMYYPLINQKEKGNILFINKYKTNQFLLSKENFKQKNNFIFKQEFSIIFFWSIPLKAHLLQISTKTCLIIDDLNPFQRNLMKISIGTQNIINKNINICHVSSEIALSNSNDTLDSLSYNPIINNSITPIGILKKKKLDLNEQEINNNNNNNNNKKFCFEKILDSNQDNIMRNLIFENMNLCVENLSKILSESCSNNNEQQLITLPNSSSSSFIETINNNNNIKNHKSLVKHDIHKNIYSNLFKHEETLKSNELYLNNNNTNIIEQLSDGIILRRGKQFGIALGEPMIRKYNENENLSRNSYHSINELNRLLSKTNCLLMKQYDIETIEDLIRLFFEQGQYHFTELMINLFKVNPIIVEQLNKTLIKWTKQLT